MFEDFYKMTPEGRFIRNMTNERKFSKNFCPHCGSQEVTEKAIPCFHFGPAPTEAVCQKCGCKF